MAHVTPTLASVLHRKGPSASLSKLEEGHRFSQLCSKYWGKVIEHDAKQWRKSHSSVKVNHTVEIGPKCFGLDLGINSSVQRCGSGKTIFGFTITAVSGMKRDHLLRQRGRALS
jgi:hypothetical protein